MSTVNHQSCDNKSEIESIEKSENDCILKLRSKNTVSYYQKQVKNIFKKGKWQNSQERRYLKFISRNKVSLKQNLSKKKRKVYLRMSRFVETRDRSQCTSHHQKMIKKYKCIDAIIAQLEISLMKLNPQDKLDMFNDSLSGQKKQQQICSQEKDKIQKQVIRQQGQQLIVEICQLNNFSSQFDQSAFLQSIIK